MHVAAGLRTAAAVVAAVVLAGCSGNPKPTVSVPATPAPAAVVQPPPAAQPPADPVASLIAESESHFKRGEEESRLGHLSQARAEFDKALDLLADSPHGARTEPRLRDHFDRLVERISVIEVAALTTGDGFTEKPYEPASIDDLLSTSTFDAPEPAAPDLARAVEADLASTEHDVPIPFNERVLRYVDLFQGRLRDWVQAGLERGAQYLPMIQGVFRAEGLPLDLAYVPLIESAFKPNALSRAKAKGVWQFMRDTAKENGLRHDWFIDERADPEKATLAAARYLKTLNGMFGGDWHLALASYNGGPGRVQRALKASRASDFWDLSDSSRFLPRETREYVPMILAAIIIARNPAQYGFSLSPAAAVEYDKVTVTRPVDLRLVAEWAGVSIDEVQSLNPELRRWTTPVRDQSYDIKVPAGTGTQLEQRLASASATELSNLKWHTVKRGDTIATVARRFSVSRTDLAEANHLSLKSHIVPGQTLLIPRAPALLARRVDQDDAPLAAAAAPAAQLTLASTPSAAGGRAVDAVAPGENSRLVHQVRRGDTLSSIARLYQTTVDAIRSWNKLRTSRLNIGDRLTIFQGRNVASLQ